MKGDHRSYICNLKAVAKRKPEKKILACTGSLVLCDTGAAPTN